jgi:SOS-response transcriptional repressor LexA
MLTEQQAKCLHFIEDYIHAHGGISPSLYEMMEPLEVASKASVHRVLTELEQRGFIRRFPKRPRSIEIVDRFATAESIVLRRVAAEIVEHCESSAAAEPGYIVPAAMIQALREAL